MYKVDISYRSLIWQRLMHSPLSLFDKVKPNEMVSRTANDTSTISSVVAGLLPTLVGMVYSAYYIIDQLIGYDWELGLGLLAYTPVYVAALIWYGKWNYRTLKHTHNRLASLTQFLSELLVSIPLIKSFATEHKEEKRGKESLQKYYKASMKQTIVNWINTPMISLLTLVMDLFVIVFGIYLVSQGTITIDIWIAFFMYVGMYFGILETFGHMFIQMKESQGASSRIALLLENDLEEYERNRSVEDANRDLEFNQVSFGYGDKKVLEDVTFTVKNGSKTAIVGPSGGGKSTILALVQQLYDPDKGSITYGGIPIEEYHLTDWRKLFSFVAQDSPLLNGTIRDNIVYGVDRDVSETEINEAARAANALQFIKESPQGFETYVGETGANLSGGQRQRIAIARALLRNAKFLLLDEAMASLDGQSKKAVQKAMEKLMEGKTSIVVAHDLSTILNSDQIILINEGTVEAIGTHKELYQRSPLYKGFVEYLSQSSVG
ncbi:Multidrug resistance ABC transporter ATP-binding/permease protein BmrA [Lentibacillus sp. JNUCC-1]|uniref:ABC transporter ATP-binding protein n=1 Tax=Lentibacillus sp. JNUCC-1 TaxID=2654513 RepID=UPI0012E90F5A|nr:ABC transporter ATP-binding protein [Lentibacillus sp. JNUCC-1]MUV38207.1 Multidrug resistance ABC transporter ATP-binding/permease protein BmrA [Lentibacillus sp. JNUCC-1]